MNSIQQYVAEFREELPYLLDEPPGKIMELIEELWPELLAGSEAADHIRAIFVHELGLFAEDFELRAAKLQAYSDQCELNETRVTQ